MSASPTLHAAFAIGFALARPALPARPSNSHCADGSRNKWASGIARSPGIATLDAECCLELRAAVN